jgi:two-component system, cell cycle response regulator
VGQRIANAMRSYDWSGRYGGEEFLTVLINCNEETLAGCAERIRRSIASELVRVPDVDLTVTVSIGTILSSTSDSLTCSQLIAVADAALYRAKARGRNCVDVGSLDNLARFSISER